MLDVIKTSARELQTMHMTLHVRTSSTVQKHTTSFTVDKGIRHINCSHHGHT